MKYKNTLFFKIKKKNYYNQTRLETLLLSKQLKIIDVEYERKKTYITLEYGKNDALQPFNRWCFLWQSREFHGCTRHWHLLTQYL